jgi:hypothetical protein
MLVLSARLWASSSFPFLARHLQACLCNRCGSEVSRKKKKPTTKPGEAATAVHGTITGTAPEHSMPGQTESAALLPAALPPRRMPAAAGNAAEARASSLSALGAAEEKGQGLASHAAQQTAVEERRCTHCGVADTPMWRRCVGRKELSPTCNTLTFFQLSCTAPVRCLLLLLLQAPHHAQAPLRPLRPLRAHSQGPAAGAKGGAFSHALKIPCNHT